MKLTSLAGAGIAGLAIFIAAASPGATNPNGAARVFGPAGQRLSTTRRSDSTIARPRFARARASETASPCNVMATPSFVGVVGSGNVAGGYYSGVLAGLSNHAYDQADAISGGTLNAIGNGGSADSSSIAGGGYNTIVSSESSIDAGFDSEVQGDDAAIGAGPYNDVQGVASGVAAGYWNSVTGSGSFIGAGDSAYGQASPQPDSPGNQARATHSGSFVWSDDAAGESPVADAAAYQFVVRATGGTTIYTSVNLASGVKLAAGSGTWASLSDRSPKTDIVPLDDASILAKVAALPVSTWRYKTEQGVRHADPMAQDFYAAFGVGEDDRHITSIDEDGVALAAIKALDKKLQRSNVARARGRDTPGEALMSQMRAARVSHRPQIPMASAPQNTRLERPIPPCDSL